MDQQPVFGPASERLGFGYALLAVFLAGIVGGAVTGVIGSARHVALGDTRSILLMLFVGILVGGASLVWCLRLFGWSVSPVVAVGTVAMAHVVSVVVSLAVAHAEAGAVRQAPSVFPGLGAGFTGLGALAGLAVLFLEAWIVHQAAGRRAV
jgi:hypothetical protein